MANREYREYQLIKVIDDLYIEDRDGFFKAGWDWMDIPYRIFDCYYEAQGYAVLAIPDLKGGDI